MSQQQSPSMSQPDLMLAKIRKLLAKAEDPASSPQEAETYTAKAAQLIADYGIDAAMLSADDPGSDRVADRVVKMDAPYARDRAQLLCDIAVHLQCRPVLRTRTPAEGAREYSVHLFGHESDLARTDMLFTSLLMQSTQRLATTPVPAWEHKAAFRRSWQAGFRMSISRRLAETESRARQDAEARTTAGGRAGGLVLADRSAQVEETLRTAYPTLARARARTLSGSGIRDGYLAGSQADLGQQRFRGSRSALPSG